MKKWPIAIAVAASIVLAAGPSLAAKKFITFSAGGSSGSWYVGAAVMSELIRKAYPELQVTPIPGGAVSNMRTVGKGKAELAFAIYQTLYEAYTGTGAYKRKYDNLRSVLSTIPFYQQIIVQEDSSIRSLKDLKGKRVTGGSKGFGGEIAFKRLLPFYGLSYEQIDASGGKVFFRNYNDSAKMFMDRQIDLLSTGSPAPHPPYIQITSLRKVRFLSIEPAIAKAYNKKFPGYIAGTMPAGIYKGQDKPLQTLRGFYGIITQVKVPAEDIYKMTKAIYEGRKKIADAYSAYKAMIPKRVAVSGIPIPMHEGAKRYFKEIGLLK